MADYIPITEAQSDPEAAVDSSLIKRLRDNPEAVREGDDTAPRIQGVALGTFIARQTSVGTGGVAITDLDTRARLLVQLVNDSAPSMRFRLSSDNGTSWSSYVETGSVSTLLVNLSNGDYISDGGGGSLSTGVGSVSGSNFNAIEFSASSGTGNFEAHYLNRGSS